jgi:hypothetical protein
MGCGLVMAYLAYMPVMDPTVAFPAPRIRPAAGIVSEPPMDEEEQANSSICYDVLPLSPGPVPKPLYILSFVSLLICLVAMLLPSPFYIYLATCFILLLRSPQSLTHC